MRVLVTGSRDWRDLEIIQRALEHIHYNFVGPHTLVHGDARGTDRLAASAAELLNWKVEAYPADWIANGRAAGPIRNTKMVRLGADVCLAFPLASSIGTWDCVQKTRHAGIQTYVYPDMPQL